MRICVLGGTGNISTSFVRRLLLQGHDVTCYNRGRSGDVPEFRPAISLEQGMQQVIEAMDREGRIPDSDTLEWEDRLIAAQQGVGKA